MTMTTQLPIGLKRRVNLFVSTTSPEEDVNEYNNHDDFAIESNQTSRQSRIPYLDRQLNTREKLIFAVLSVLFFVCQVLADFYLWNQTKHKIYLVWGVHQILLLVVVLIIMFRTQLNLNIIGPPRTMCVFDYFVEYEKISGIVYHSFQFGQVFYRYFAVGTLNAQCIYHTVTFICVLACICKKYKHVF
jgi:hypothetical protein